MEVTQPPAATFFGPEGGCIRQGLLYPLVEMSKGCTDIVCIDLQMSDN